MKSLIEPATRMLAAGRLQEAAALCQRMLALQPNNAEALNVFAQVLHQAGQHAQAEELLRRALHAAPAHSDTYVNLSAVLSARGKFEEAIAVCEDGLRRFREHKALLNHLAINLDHAGRYDEAVRLLEARVNSHPGFGQGHYHLGIVYRKMGRVEEALACLRKAAKLDPRELQALTASADCLLRLGRPEEALEPLDAALRLRPYHVRALALKSIALAGAGKAEEERSLSDPRRLVQAVHLSELGYDAAAIDELNARLSAYASAHPSMRLDPPANATYNGWHSGNIAADGEEALRPLKALISHALRRRRETLGDEDESHPFRRALPPAFALHLWTVKLEGGGNMTPHIHTDGWLSGVYYVDVPEVVNDPQAGQAGWIRFGVPVQEYRLPRAPLVHTVKPQPGLMLTFPSYLWHATVPLPPETRARICYSYDLQPRPAHVPGLYAIA